MKLKGLTLLCCSLVISAFIGCDSDDSAKEYIIPVINRCNDLFSFEDYFKRAKTVYVNVDDEYPVSAMIRDVFFTSRYAFILDANNYLSKIDLKKGKVIKQIQVKRFQCTLSGDNKHLYLMDYGNDEGIIEYDLDLTPTDTLKTKNISVSSFCKIKDGFIFLNGKPSSSRGKFVISDNKINKAVSYVKHGERHKSNKYEPVMILSSEVFIPDSHGNVLCFDPEGNNGYKYDGERLKRVFHIGTDLDDPDAVVLKNVQAIFSLRGKILFHYYGDDFTDGVAYFDKNNNLVAQGPAYNASEGGLFRYTYKQVGKKLVRIHMEMPEDRGVFPYSCSQIQIDYYR